MFKHFSHLKRGASLYWHEKLWLSVGLAALLGSSAIAAPKIVIDPIFSGPLKTEARSRLRVFTEDVQGFRRPYEGQIIWRQDADGIIDLQDNGFLTGLNPGETQVEAIVPDLGLATTADVTVVNDSIEVLFDAPNDWQRANIWFWYLDGNADVTGYDAQGNRLNAIQPSYLGNWPGLAMQPLEGRPGWFQFSIPHITDPSLAPYNLERQPVRIIFNNPDRGEQTRMMLHYDGCFLSYNRYLGDPANRIIDGRWDSPLDCRSFAKKPRLVTGPQGGPLYEDKSAIRIEIIGDELKELRYTINGRKPSTSVGTLVNPSDPLIWLQRSDFDQVDGQVDICFYATTASKQTLKECRDYYFDDQSLDKDLPLGVSYTRTSTRFTIWSPDRNQVTLWLDGESIPLGYVGNEIGVPGVYSVEVPGDHRLKRYHYIIDDKVVRDPYAVMTVPGTDFNIILDLDNIEPEGGWAPQPKLAKPEDAIIYELGVRDFTIDPSSGVSPELRGTYLGAVQPNRYLNQGQGNANPSITTGIEHLKELGVTHVQLMPVFDAATCSLKDRLDSPDCYNWGYDPENFNIPEENFSLKPNDYEFRVREFQTMVNEFHKAGIRVVMDVVYNHTWVRPWREADEGEAYLGPITGQYFLKDSEGIGYQLTGTGNTLNGRHPMVSRYIRESLAHWVETYGIDGFRFDLAGVFNYIDIREWMIYLKQRFPDRQLIAYGEPWTALEDWDPDHFRLNNVRFMTNPDGSPLNFGGFNYPFRNAIKGNNDDGEGGGYAFNQVADFGLIMNGLRGSLGQGNIAQSSFTADPSQTINYASSHDNLTLFDKIEAWAGLQSWNISFEYKKRISIFANSIVLASQGIPMLHGGSEFLRTKFGDPNTYNAGDSKNKFDWNRKAYFPDVVNAYRDLINLRRDLPALRMATADEINRNLNVNDYGSGLIRVDARGAEGRDLIYFLNSGADRSVTLPSGNWRVRFENAAGSNRTVSGSVKVGGTSLTLLIRE